MNQLQQRLAQLEQAIAPKGRQLVFVCHPEEDDDRPRADQLAAFNAKHGVTPNDTVHEIRVSYS